ncbi:hypothetical protein EDB85DRAFT_2074321 [Lactarius pseudohatsudake]|nr:hypothetical protein EDB85DRAFT_2074321 [Lactarius pseudohatsudake]
MDSDRKSTVSSFYGRRSSVDALTRDYAAPAQPPRLPEHCQEVLLFHQHERCRVQRMSFFDAGREEPVRAATTRRHGLTKMAGMFMQTSTTRDPATVMAFGIGNNEARCVIYLSSFHGSHVHAATSSSPTAFGENGRRVQHSRPVEMVTVPALGASGARTSLMDMTKRGRQGEEKENLGRSGRRSIVENTALFGRKWLTRRTLVFFLFGLSAAIGIVLAFTIPRVPCFNINGRPLLCPPLAGSTSPFRWNSAASPPTSFRVPCHSRSTPARTSYHFVFKHLDAQLYDLEFVPSRRDGSLEPHQVPSKEILKHTDTLNFTYVATNDSDQTFQYTGGVRPALRFRLNIDMSIAGLPTKHSTATSVTNAQCPIELPSSAG